MANTFQSSSVYIDSTGSLTTKRCRVAYIVFTTSAAADALTLRDGDEATDPLKVTVKGAVADETVCLDFSNAPLVFENGIYCSAISTDSTATLILTSEGAGT